MEDCGLVIGCAKGKVANSILEEHSVRTFIGRGVRQEVIVDTRVLTCEQFQTDFVAVVVCQVVKRTGYVTCVNAQTAIDDREARAVQTSRVGFAVAAVFVSLQTNTTREFHTTVSFDVCVDVQTEARNQNCTVRRCKADVEFSFGTRATIDGGNGRGTGLSYVGTVFLVANTKTAVTAERYFGRCNTCGCDQSGRCEENFFHLVSLGFKKFIYSTHARHMSQHENRFALFAPGTQAWHKYTGRIDLKLVQGCHSRFHPPT